jgi:ACS family hexuronate transporter-like MFS transporter
MTRVRWWMLALVFFATTINYLDRILLGFLMPIIRQEIHISEQEYGWITGSFQFTYMLGFLAAGKLIDRFGSRLGYAVSLIWWSVAAMAHSLATGALSLGFWRAFLGLGESGNFPSAIKAVAEWFPKKDRAFATGIFNAGSNVASMAGPPIFVWMNLQFGWRACFLITASLGFLWLVAWLLYYKLPENHAKVNAQEFAYIASDRDAREPDRPIGWMEALGYKQTWGFALAKFLTDPVWWFYLYWLPLYLYDVRKLNLNQIGWALPVIYLMADIGSVGGGWLSGALIRRGWPSGKARKCAMGLCAAAMPVAAMSALAESYLVAIALISLATAAHQGWSANLYTTTSDVFPKSLTASVTGIGGCLGGLGGFLFSAVIPGYVVANFGYTPAILTAGTFHLAAWVVVHKMLGDMRPLEPRPRLS